MSKMQLLRVLITERLSVAAEEIFGVVGRTVAEYEEELSRQQKLLDSVLGTEIKTLCSGLSQHSSQESSSIQENYVDLPDANKQEHTQPFEVDNVIGKESISPLSIFTPVRVKDEEEDYSNNADNDSNMPDVKDCVEHANSGGSSRYDGASLLCGPTKVEMKIREVVGGAVSDLTGEHDTSFSLEHPADNGEDSYSYDGWMETRGQEAELKTQHPSSSTANPNMHTQAHAHVLDEPSDQVFTCDICGKGFSQKTTLMFHMREHVGGKRFTCTVCGKGFDNKTHFERHAFTHSGEKPYVCHVCYKGFTAKFNLMSHLMTHSGQYPYSCHICGKGFGVSSYLKVHMRFHTGVKPHCCAICGKAFQVKSNLMYHMRTHTGEKPHSCSICGKGFTRSEALKDHMNTHTGARPYVCSVCGKCFSHRTGLFQHLKTHSTELNRVPPVESQNT